MTGRGKGVPTPYYVAPGTAPARGRVLLFSYHFPPSTAAGATRWARMVESLAERGWGADVIARAPEEHGVADWARLDRLPPGTRMYGVPTAESRLSGVVASVVRWRTRRSLRRGGAPAEPASVQGATRPGAPPADAPNIRHRDEVLRAPFTVGEVRRSILAVNYVANQLALGNAAARVAARVLGPEHRAVISSGPPHGLHPAAGRLAARAGLPFVMDMRDPWSLVEIVSASAASRALFAMYGGLERRAVRQARLVLANTDLAASMLRARYPDAADRVLVVMNGSDPIRVPPRPAGRTTFGIAYTGQIYSDRSPTDLFEAAGTVVRRYGLGPEEFALRFMGAFDDATRADLRAAADRAGLGPHLELRPQGPQRAVFELLAESAVLVSLPQSNFTAVPSKLFEYAQFPAWLLALYDEGSAVELLLRGSGADLLRRGDVAGITDALERHLHAFRRGELPAPVNADGRFDRARHAARFLDRFEAALEAAQQARRLNGADA